MADEGPYIPISKAAFGCLDVIHNQLEPIQIRPLPSGSRSWEFFNRRSKLRVEMDSAKKGSEKNYPEKRRSPRSEELLGEKTSQERGRLLSTFELIGAQLQTLFMLLRNEIRHNQKSLGSKQTQSRWLRLAQGELR